MAEKNSREPLAEKVFDNLIFIAEVFADREEEEIPDVPMLELARSFELRHLAATSEDRREANRESRIELPKRANILDAP